MTNSSLPSDNAIRLTHLGLDALNPIFSPDGKRIAFSAGGRGAPYHVYMIDTDGSGLRRLTDELGPNFVFCFSPDGIRIAYMSDPTGEDANYFDIYTVWIDGSNKQRLTFSGGASPAFSPDGHFIVFENACGGVEHLFRMNADGAGLVQLTHAGSDQPARFPGQDNGDPIFSPDGQWIYFTSTRHCLRSENQHEIYKMHPDGSEVARLSHTDGGASHPTLSPDGQIIAFTAWMEDCKEGIRKSNIHTIRPDGSEQKQIEDSNGINWVRSISSDGKWIAFDSPQDVKSDDVTRNWDIYLIRTDGSELVRLTDNEWLDREPTFSPDGRSIAFMSDRDGTSEIYLVEL